MGFAINRRIVVGVLETVPGTAEFNLVSTFPANTDHNNRITNIEMKTTIAMDDEVGDVATGDDAELWSVSGVRSGEVSFTIPYTWGGTVTDEPHMMPYLNACGLQAADYTIVGKGIYPNSDYNCRSMTIAVFDIDCGTTPTCKGYLYKGCVGDWELGASAVGAPWKFKFKFRGAYVGDYAIASTNVPVITSPSEKAPEKLLSNTVAINGVFMYINSFNLLGGNDIKMIPDQSDPTGIKQYYIASRKARLQMQSLMQSMSVEDVFTNITTEATGAGSIVGDNITIALPRVQYLTSEQSEIEGLVGYSHNFKLLRNNTGYTVGKAIAALADGATFEFLQGARA